MDPNSIQVILAPAGSSNVETICSIIQAVSVVFAAVVAIRGINAWKEEFRGKRRIELAENALELCYRVQAAITAIRCLGGVIASESIAAEAEKTEPAPERKPSEELTETHRRIEERQEVIEKLYAMRYRVKVGLGRKAAGVIEELRNVVIEIRSAANGIMRIGPVACTKKRSAATEEGLRKHEEVIWESPPGDAVAKRVDTAVKSMEDICRPLIEGRHRRRWWGGKHTYSS